MSSISTRVVCNYSKNRNCKSVLNKSRFRFENFENKKMDFELKIHSIGRVQELIPTFPII